MTRSAFFWRFSMSYLVRSALALLACTAMVGVASAATYSWPLAISVPVTVSYPNPPPGFTVVLNCILYNAGGDPILGRVSANLPYTVSGGVASYRSTVNLSISPNARASGAPPVTGDEAWCYLTPGFINGKQPPWKGQTRVTLTLP